MKKRPSQGTHKSQPRKGTAVRGRRRLNEYPWRLKCQKNGEAGFGEDWWRLRSARRSWTSLVEESQHQKVGHPPSRANVWDSGRRRKAARGSVFGSSSLRKVADLFFALQMMWSVSKKVTEKKSPENKSWRWWGFSDHDMTDRKTLRDGKGDRNETRSLDGFPKLITRVNQKE